MLTSRVNDFRSNIREGIVTGDDYHQFFRTLSPYLEIEKPSFWSSFNFYFNIKLATCIGGILCGILQGGRMMWLEIIII